LARPGALKMPQLTDLKLVLKKPAPGILKNLGAWGGF
jgi:hypothetical protein